MEPGEKAADIGRGIELDVDSKMHRCPVVFTDQVRDTVIPAASSRIRSRISPNRKKARTS